MQYYITQFFRLNYIIKEIQYTKITVTTRYYHEIWVYAGNKTFGARRTRAKMWISLFFYYVERL